MYGVPSPRIGEQFVPQELNCDVLKLKDLSDIPLSAFPGLNLTTGSNTIHTRFWYGSAFTVDITSIKVL